MDGTQPEPRYRHLFEPLPDELEDSAFLDRIHGYLPGWEIPRITPQSLATGVGFVTDYFGELLVRLRDEDFQGKLRDLGATAGMTRRELVAVERLGSGLVKQLYPDGQTTQEALERVLLTSTEDNTTAKVPQGGAHATER